RDGLQQRGLAGAVGAEQRDDLACLHREVHIEEDLHRPVGDIDAATFEQGGPGGGDLVAHGCGRGHGWFLPDVVGTGWTSVSSTVWAGGGEVSGGASSTTTPEVASSSWRLSSMRLGTWMPRRRATIRRYRSRTVYIACPRPP